MKGVKIFGLFEMVVGVLLWANAFIASKILIPVLPLLFVVAGLLTWLRKSAGRYLNLIVFIFQLIAFILQTAAILMAIIFPDFASKFVAEGGQLVSFRHLPIPLLIIFISSYAIYYFTHPKVKEQFK